MTNGTEDRARRQWLAMLAKLTSPMHSEEAARGLAAMVPLLSSMPDRYFTQESLRFVADRCKRVPSYAELRDHLGAWWKSTLPANATPSDAYPALPGPSPDDAREPAEVERHAVADMVKAFKATTGVARSHITTPESERPAPRHLSDQQLLAEYEALAKAGNALAATRAAMLRQRLGIGEEIAA